jgi:hypothetical protein
MTKTKKNECVKKSIDNRTHMFYLFGHSVGMHW